MNAALLSVLVFTGITMTSVACWLVYRDLFLGETGSRTQRVLLSRLPLARDTRIETSLIGRFDHWFEQLTTQSGLGWSPMVAMLTAILAGLLVGGLVFLWLDSPLPGILGCLLGAGAVFGYLSYCREKRTRLLQDQLPDAIEMLARGVHAGESLDQALDMVGESAPEPLALEFRRAANQMTLGLSVEAVMRSLVFRVQLQDMQIFTSTLTVHRQAGGNLAHTLDRIATVIRARLRSTRQQRSVSSAGRLSARFLSVMGPVIFLYLFVVQRDYINQLLESPTGQTLLLVAVCLEIAGLIWVARLTRTV